MYTYLFIYMYISIYIYIQSNIQKDVNNALKFTSEHHPCLVALSKTTRRTIFPSDFINNAVIPSSTQVVMVTYPKWKKLHCLNKYTNNLKIENFKNTRGREKREKTEQGGEWIGLKADRAEWHGHGKTQWLLHICPQR